MLSDCPQVNGKALTARKKTKNSVEVSILISLKLEAMLKDAKIGSDFLRYRLIVQRIITFCERTLDKGRLMYFLEAHCIWLYGT